MPDNAPKRPHVILIITDQQRYDTIAALGYPHADTPNIDRLVRNGVSFSQCHVTAPSCGPSRASLFTGYYPHNAGAQRNNDPWPRLWVEDLREAGYYCVNVGKMHADPYNGMHGFHERFVVENKQRREAEPVWSGNPHVFDDEWDKALAVRGHQRPEKSLYRARPDAKGAMGAYDWELPPDLHPDTFVGELATRWLDQAAIVEDEPLFLEIGFPGPHPPFDPVREYTEPYMDRDLPLQPVTEEEVAAQPATLQSLRQRMIDRFIDSVHHEPFASPEKRHRQRAYYLANITMIDEQVGKILAKLEERGILEDSVVMFTSDHGDCMGDHGMIEKWNMYDSAVRVPLVVSAPKRFSGGRTVDALTQWFDIGPTILELAGMEPHPKMEAQSLLPFLRDDPDAERRQYVFSEHAPDLMLRDVDHLLMIRDERWKLVDYRGTGEVQLFDLQEDPGEVRDLAKDPGHAARIAELKEALNDWFVTSTTAANGWWKDPAATPGDGYSRKKKTTMDPSKVEVPDGSR